MVTPCAGKQPRCAGARGGGDLALAGFPVGGRGSGRGAAAGPVHLNLAFREPLIGSGEAFAARPQGRAGGPHGTGAVLGRSCRPGGGDLLVGAGERGLIVAGVGAGSPDAVWQLARAAGWPVSPVLPAGAGSRGRVCGRCPAKDPAGGGVATGSRTAPGRAVASRVVNEWLASLRCQQVLVDPWGAWAAPDHLPTEVVVASPKRSAGRSREPSQQDATRGQELGRREERAQAAIDKALRARTA